MIVLENLSPSRFSGYVRTTTDRPLREARYGGDVWCAPGRMVGVDTQVVDVFCELDPGQKIVVDPEAMDGNFAPSPQLPSNPASFFGGPVTIGGVEMHLVAPPKQDGAAITSHLRTRIGPMLVADLWLRWYPHQQEIMHGELLVVASNPSAPDVTATIPADFSLRFGDAIVWTIGRGVRPSIEAGEVLADGQGRAVPVVLFWPRHSTRSRIESFFALITGGVVARGVSKLLPTGNPILPQGFNSKEWGRPLWSEAEKRLHTWQVGVVGPAATSGDTGAQEGEQVFVRGECMTDDGAGCVAIAYWSALKMAARPCHHREADGSWLRLDTHPHLVTYDGRSHWNTGVSPDRSCGKPITPPIAHGWWGPDREHWMANTLAAAARLTGSPCLQALLDMQAKLYLFGETVPSMKPGWSTNGPGAARAIGYAGMLVVRLWQDMEDRTLAAQVVDRYRKRFAECYQPALAWAAGDVWDVRVDDPRLGPGKRWQPWQNALGAYGLDEACEVLNIPEGRALALRGAKAVFANAFVRVNGQWTTRDVGVVDQEPHPGTGFYDLFGCPLALAVILRHEPQHEQAREAWEQIKLRATQLKHTQWLAPQ